MKYYVFNNKNYFYLNENDCIHNWSCINYMDKLQSININFVDIAVGLFRVTLKPLANDSKTYVLDYNLADCIRAYEQAGKLREVSFQDYCLAKLKVGESMNRREVKEIFKKLADHPLWDKGCQEKLKELYFNMMEG